MEHFKEKWPLYAAGAIVVSFLMAMSLMVGVVWQASRMTPDHDAVTIDRTVTITNRTSREDAVLTVIRMGVEDWIRICAWESGKSGHSRDAMFRSCTVRWGIGEPLHEDRRKPR